MTKNIEVEEPGHQAGLLACCRHLAKLIGQEDFGSELSDLTERPGPEGRKETLESVMWAGRAAGLSTAIIPAAAGPVCRPHRALAGGEEQEETITLQAPLLDGQVRHETLSRQGRMIRSVLRGCVCPPASVARHNSRWL